MKWTELEASPIVAIISPRRHAHRRTLPSYEQDAIAVSSGEKQLAGKPLLCTAGYGHECHISSSLDNEAAVITTAK